MMKIGIGLVFIFCAFISCKKESNYIADQKLQQFWQYEKTIDANQKTVHTYPFDPQDYYNFGIDVKFTWNDHTRLFEIIGQGPARLFWGEYSLKKNQLSNQSFSTNSLPDIDEVMKGYESWFFNSLKSVYEYEIKDNKLYLNYGQGGEKHVFSMSEKQYNDDTKPYLTATINNAKWEADVTEIRASLSGNSLSFVGDRNEFNATEVTSYISFNFVNMPLAKGVYHFNNDGIILPQSGTSGSYSYMNVGAGRIDARTSGGFIEINKLNRVFIEGRFEFTAETYGDTPKKVFEVMSGKFLIPITNQVGWFNPYTQ